MDRFQKRKLILRQQLVGARYYNALIAMEFAEKFHCGLRKDGVTPEFDHQISLALHALTLPNVMFPEELIAVAFLHDVREDYNVSDVEIRELFVDKEFSDRVARAVDRMTKVVRGVKRDPNALFDDMSNDPIASMAKLLDRAHNFQTMVGVFTIPKQKEYIKEALEYFFPMAKRARRKFPHQVRAYENLKWTLLSQIELIEAAHRAGEVKQIDLRPNE